LNSQDRLLSPPSARASNFSSVHKRQRELLEQLEHILIYQAYHALDDDSGLRPNRFYANPNGRLGIDTICNPSLEPIKMCKLLQRNYSNPRQVCIVGYPQIDWQGDPDRPGPLKDYLNYSNGRLAHQVDARARLAEALEECASKEKKNRRRKADEEERAEASLPAMFGWPVGIRGGWYSDFLSSLCPVTLQLRRLSQIDVEESLQCWTLNLGGLPPLALCLIRECMLFDPASPETTRLNFILLRELDVPGNLQLIRQRYYSSSVFSHKHIAMLGCQEGSYMEMLNHIQTSVRACAMSPGTAVHLLSKATEYGCNVFVGMVESNAFLSARVTQSLDLMNKIAHEERNGRANFCKGMRAYQRHLLQLGEEEALWQGEWAHLLSPYDRARRALLLALIDVNRFYRLNSGNLQLLVEIMISMLAHTIGGKNKTHDMFGRGLEIAPCCGTLFEYAQVCVLF
jgi:hypothetical protein